jgi:hypothetical protein
MKPAPKKGPSKPVDPPEPVQKKDSSALNEEARLYPWRLFGCGQLAVMIGVDTHVISEVSRHPQTCFVKGSKARPEWVVAFIEQHLSLKVSGNP